MRITKEIGLLRAYMRQYAWHFTTNDDDADDLTQQTMLQALEKMDRFHGGNLLAWLRVIMRNKCYENYRHSKRDPTFPCDWIDEQHDESTPTPDEYYRAGEQMKELHEALDSLKAPFCEVVELIIVEGYSYAESAAILNVPIGTIRSRLHRARRKLSEV